MSLISENVTHAQGWKVLQHSGGDRQGLVRQYISRTQHFGQEKNIRLALKVNFYLRF